VQPVYSLLFRSDRCREPGIMTFSSDVPFRCQVCQRDHKVGRSWSIRLAALFLSKDFLKPNARLLWLSATPFRYFDIQGTFAQSPSAGPQAREAPGRVSFQIFFFRPRLMEFSLCQLGRPGALFATPQIPLGSKLWLVSLFPSPRWRICRRSRVLSIFFSQELFLLRDL